MTNLSVILNYIRYKPMILHTVSHHISKCFYFVMKLCFIYLHLSWEHESRPLPNIALWIWCRCAASCVARWQKSTRRQYFVFSCASPSSNALIIFFLQKHIVLLFIARIFFFFFSTVSNIWNTFYIQSYLMCYYIKQNYLWLVFT